jgi:mRNA interferase HigB
MRVTGTDKICEFIKRHTDSAGWLKAWLAEARDDDWQGPQDVKARYQSASILDDSRVIFNVGGNKYRMEVQIAYKNKTVAVKRLGTHAEYDRWHKGG